MKEVISKYTTLYNFDVFGGYHEIRHFVTTRKGGKSEGPFKGLNMGFGTDDLPEAVSENRYMLSEAFGVPLEWFVFPRQTHSANIVVVDKSMVGRGAFNRGDGIHDTDALICNIKNIVIVVQAADCVPVLLLDPINSVVAAIHAGWRGTAKEIVPKTIDEMKKHFGTEAKDVVAGIGPSIGQCCYNVGEEVHAQFENIGMSTEVLKENGEGMYLDLWLANKIQLLRKGVSKENIEVASLCTKCNHDTFFSSRHGNGNTGRFAAGIMLV